MKKFILWFILLFPEILFAQTEFVSDTTIRPSKPNAYRLAILSDGTMRIVPKTGNTKPIIGGNSPVLSVNGLVGSLSLTTANIPENSSNKYYTDQRVQNVGDGRYPLLTGSYNNPSWFTGLSWTKLFGQPTTLSGYGITDGVRSINSVTPVNGDLSFNTGGVPEGSNLYFTNTRARSSLSSSSSGLLFNNSTGVFSLSLNPSSVGLGNVDNTPDSQKMVSSYQQSALNLKADKTSVLPYLTVADYATASVTTVTGLSFIMVTTDERYNETNSLYIKIGSTLYKLIRTNESTN